MGFVAGSSIPCEQEWEVQTAIESGLMPTRTTVCSPVLIGLIGVLSDDPPPGNRS